MIHSSVQGLPLEEVKSRTQFERATELGNLGWTLKNNMFSKVDFQSQVLFCFYGAESGAQGELGHRSTMGPHMTSPQFPVLFCLLKLAVYGASLLLTGSGSTVFKNETHSPLLAYGTGQACYPCCLS